MIFIEKKLLNYCKNRACTFISIPFQLRDETAGER